jgi:hypothetical protein
VVMRRCFSSRQRPTRQGPDRPSRAATLRGEAHEGYTREVDSSHVPMLSNPTLVIDMIRAAAEAVTSSRGVA